MTINESRSPGGTRQEPCYLQDSVKVGFGSGLLIWSQLPIIAVATLRFTEVPYLNPNFKSCIAPADS